MKFEMHLHTAENDPYVNVCAADAVREYKKIGYDGIVFTDHFGKFIWKWRDGKNGLGTWEEKIERWLTAYRSAKKVGDEIGLKVFLGMELRFTKNINDYLIYGMDEEFIFSHPDLDLYSPEEFFKIKPEKMLVYQAHPFREDMVVGSAENIFGVEVYNSGTPAPRNQMAEAFADIFSLRKISGSDFHHISQLAKGGVDFFCNIETYDDLLQALKNNTYSLITPN